MLEEWVRRIDRIKEDHSRFCRFPGLVYNLIEELSRTDGFDNFPIAGIAQGIWGILLVVFPEIWHNQHGNIEIPQGFVSSFCGDKFFNIRMIGIQDSHVCATPDSSLLDHFGHGIEE